jgi:hypothetical protein
MNAVIYLIVRQYVNRIKRIFKKPLNAILTIFAVLCIISGPVLMIVIPNNYTGIVGTNGREMVIAGIQLFIGITLILSALSQQSGLFAYSEACLLFSSPFSKRTILLYSTMQTLPASVMTALFMCFYFPYVIGKAMTPLKLLATLVVMSLMIFCVYILYYYIYIQDIAHEGLKKRLKKYIWLFFAVIAAVYAALWIINDRNFGKAAITFFTSDIYNAFPVFGWAKWAVAALLNDHYVTGFVPALLLLALASYILARIYYSQDVDFFEKAQLDSIRLQKVIENLKSNGYDASGMTVKRVRTAKADFRPGAGAIMSRQLLEMKKKGPLLTFRDLLNGIIYVVIGLAAGFGFEFVYPMIIFSMVMNTTTDNWNAEFKKPYIYLIPESSFRKLLYAVMPGVIKTIFGQSVIVAAAAILFGTGLYEAVLYLLLLVSYTMLFTSAGVFTYRIMGSMTNAVLLMFMRVLFIIASAVPGGVLAAVLAAVSGNADLAFILVPLMIVNILCAMLFVFMSRKLLEQSEIMN